MAERQATVDGDHASSCLTRSCCSRRRTRSSRKARSRCPEAQLDRFSLKIALGYPTIDQEIEIVRGQRSEHPADELRPVVDVDDGRRRRARARSRLHRRAPAPLDRRARRQHAVRSTSSRSARRCGRASRSSGRRRAWALIDGRDYVSPEDVEQLFLPVLGHRIVFTPTFLAEARRHRPRRGARHVPPPLPRARASAAARRGARAPRPGRLFGREPVRRRGRPRDRRNGDDRAGPAACRARGCRVDARARTRASVAATAPTSRARVRTGRATTARTIDWKASARLSSVTRRRRVHRARALRPRDAARRDRLRPATRDGALSARAPVALEAARGRSGSSS